MHHDACPMARPCRPERCLGVFSVQAWRDAWYRTDDPPLAYHDPIHHDQQVHRDRYDRPLARRGLRHVQCDRWPDAEYVDRARHRHAVLPACGQDVRLRYAAHGLDEDRQPVRLPQDAVCVRAR